MTISSRHYRELYELIASTDSAKEAELLLKDLATPQEIEDFAERWQIIQQLHKGIPQRQIADALGVSISKVTRGSNTLQWGSGGFLHFLKKAKKSK
jgi:TrpR family trp operon transcriptional repressor